LVTHNSLLSSIFGQPNFYLRVSAVIATATLLAGWLAVSHSWYCIKTAKPILKLFGPSGSPIIEAFGNPYADTKFQGEPLHRGRLMHGGGKIGDFRVIFDGYRRLSRKRCEIGR